MAWIDQSQSMHHSSVSCGHFFFLCFWNKLVFFLSANEKVWTDAAIQIFFSLGPGTRELTENWKSMHWFDLFFSLLKDGVASSTWPVTTFSAIIANGSFMLMNPTWKEFFSSISPLSIFSIFFLPVMQSWCRLSIVQRVFLLVSLYFLCLDLCHVSTATDCFEITWSLL